MSRLYGNIIADRGESTRCSNREITTAARSFDGSVIVSLSYDANEELHVRIECADGSKVYGKTLADCTFDQFVKTLKRCKTLRNGR